MCESRPYSRNAEFQVQLGGGHTEWWHMRGSAQRNTIGLPTHFSGCVRDVTAIRAPQMGFKD